MGLPTGNFPGAADETLAGLVWFYILSHFNKGFYVALRYMQSFWTHGFLIF